MTKIADLHQKLAALGQALTGRRRRLPVAGVREAIEAEGWGRFHMAQDLGAEASRAWFAGRPLVAVDGSQVQRGASFPYQVSLLRALAFAEGEQQTEADLLSPLISGEAEPEFEAVKERRLAELEVQVALAALDRWRPHLLLFDGGFHRFQSLCPDLWAAYKAEALRLGTISVGCIEEVGSFELANRLAERFGADGVKYYDRELLWNLLKPGEWLEVEQEFKEGEGIFACFTRFSHHPQATAVDFFLEQQGQLEPTLHFLYAITPAGGRGVPWPLDLVDHEVRIRQAEANLLLESHLDLGQRELFLAPHRQRREL